MTRLTACIFLAFSSSCFSLENLEKTCRTVSVESLGWDLHSEVSPIEFAELCESLEGEEVISSLGFGELQQEQDVSFRKFFLLLKSGAVEEKGMLIYSDLSENNIYSTTSIIINSSAPSETILRVYKNSISNLYQCRDNLCSNEYLSKFSFWGKLFDNDYKELKRALAADPSVGLGGFPNVQAFDYDHRSGHVSYLAEIPHSGLWHIEFKVDSQGGIENITRIAKSVK